MRLKEALSAKPPSLRILPASETSQLSAPPSGEYGVQRTLIRTAMSATRGRRIEAAERLGLGRNTLTRKIAELGLTDELASRLPPVRKKDQVKSLDDGAA